MRCLLDPWNHGYYHWPFIAALVCWEVRGCQRLPIGAVLSSSWLWIVFARLDGAVMDVAYVAWAVACLMILLRDAYRPHMPAWSRRRVAAVAR